MSAVAPKEYKYYYDWLARFNSGLLRIDPSIYSSIGATFAISFSVLGSAWGIFNNAVSLSAVTIHHPEIRSKNLMSILLCEAIALYGLILSLMLTTSTNEDDVYIEPNLVNAGHSVLSWKKGFAYLAGGSMVGFTNVAAAAAVGVVGSTACIAHSENLGIFVTVFLGEIFAEAVAIIGLICGIVVCTGIKA